MEESEKRKERLKAMRIEASQGGTVRMPESSGMFSHGLANPLVEDDTTIPANSASPRFHYYTDPMAAFSTNKTTGQAPQQYFNTPQRPRPPDMTSFPAYQHQTINSPGQRMFQPPGAYHNYGPVGSPLASPSGRNPPSTWGPPVGTFNYNNSSNSPRGSYFTSPGSGRGTPNFSYGRGGGQGYNTSLSYGSSGRSRGGSSSYNSFSPGSGQRGRRGVGSHSPISAELRPDLYYKHEMVEDPWKELKPVIWKSQNLNPNSARSLPQESVSVKKHKRVSSEGSNKPTSEPSLAEYLAASFSEAASSNVAGDD